MRHRVAGRKLGRTSEHRLALLRNLSTALFDKEKITTTLAKAKELRPFAERLVTLSKRESLHARRQVLRHIRDRAVVGKLFDTLSARYAQRPGGYTRIIKLGPRRGDNADMAIIELVGNEPETAEARAPRKRGKPGRRKKTDAGDTAAPAKQTKTTRRKSTRRKSSAKSDDADTGRRTKKKATTKKKKTAKKKTTAKSSRKS